MQTENLIPGTDDACGAPSWFVLRCRSNHEKALRRYLDYAAFECYLPVYSAASHWSDRTKTLERLLFPGYVFVHCGADRIPEALQLPAVCGVLGGLKPAVIPCEQIESVRLVIASMLPVSPVEYCGGFAAGDRVTVRHGALKGVEGHVLKHAKGIRLVVSVEMLGRGVSIELDAAALVKAAA